MTSPMSKKATLADAIKTIEGWKFCHFEQGCEHDKEFAPTLATLKTALEAQSNVEQVKKELIAAFKRLSSLQPAYCQDCSRWIVYPSSHDADHTMSKPEKFIRASEVLNLLSKDNNAEPVTRAGGERKVPIKEVVDELRALTSYPFDPARKVSNKRRMEDVLKGVSDYASKLEDRLTEGIGQEEKSNA